MRVRRYERGDVPAMVRYLKEGLQLQPTYKRVRFDQGKVEDLLLGNLKNITFFCNVVEDEDDVVGGMVAVVQQYPFSREVYANDLITYIRDGHRDLVTITTLVKSYVQWAKERGCKQIRWGQSSGFKVEKFQLLAKRLGFTQIGSQFNMETEL